MADNAGKKIDASTSTRPPNSVMGDSDSSSDEYETAEGSAQSLEKEEQVEKDDSAAGEEELDPLPWRVAGTPKHVPEQRLHPSTVSSNSVNPSVFGEDVRPQFNPTTRRATLHWPPSGCIHIPLHEPDPSRPSEMVHSISDYSTDVAKNDTNAQNGA